MKTTRDYLKQFFRIDLASAIAGLFALIAVALSPAYAVELPDDDEQDVLVRTTLMTFNDANVTGNYSVLIAKASPQFQAQVTPEKLSTTFEGFRKNNLFIEDIVNAEYASQDKPSVDGDGVLTLSGTFKTDELTVKYRLRYAQNDKAWKVLGINVDVNKK
ncbi:hypothetical protein ACFFWD_18730 [Bradyrhizobium erythrophlei]|uniref:hypothetical protein n=1 Tax=Bradyrhizobium erythrophlei TaxID=1437360 RepID=UPI0035E685CB